MKWETYTRKIGRERLPASATITQPGKLSFNMNAVECALADNKYAVLMFDKDSNRIGLTLHRVPVDNSYPIHFNKKICAASMSCKAFLMHYGIVVTGRFPIEVDEANNILIIPLNN